MKVRLLEDDEQFGHKKGDEFDGVPYQYEPDCKFSPNGVDNNFYKHQLERKMPDGTWKYMHCSCCMD